MRAHMFERIFRLFVQPYGLWPILRPGWQSAIRKSYLVLMVIAHDTI